MQRERKPKNFLPKPIYRGGPKAMSKFIGENLKYPPEALKNKVEGTVVIRLAINYKGKVTGSKIKSGLGSGCDEEAQRVVSLLEFDVDSKVRKGKILFHKNINIRFRLPKEKPVSKKKAEPRSKTQLSYTITTKKEVTKKTPQRSSSYSYTIKINN